MELIADGLLISGAFAAALYCYVLSRRVSALKNLDSGLGGAIAGLSARVEQTQVSLADTKAATGAMTRDLKAATARAEMAAGRLELLLATLHDTASGEETPVRNLRERPQPEEIRQTAPPPPAEENRIVAALRRIADGDS